MDVQLHEQLRKDCHVLGRMDVSYLLLLDNALVPWFILVPETDKTEFHELDPALQGRVLKEINRLSAWVDTSFEVDKLNVALIGNKVPQMHIHVVGRNRNDYCWPGVVWASPERQAYGEPELEAIRTKSISDLQLTSS